MSTRREVIKCRRCKVAAEGIIVDGKFTEVYCPVCRVSLDGTTYYEMIVKQQQYLARKIAQDLLRDTMPERREPGVTVSHSFTELNEPDWAFFIELED